MAKHYMPQRSQQPSSKKSVGYGNIEPPKVYSKPEEVKPVSKYTRVKVANTDVVNVRKGPGKDCAVLFIASNGDQFTAENSLTSDWIYVRDNLGRTGYIMACYVEAIES